MSPDDAFGPQLGGAFDFTLTFDHAILSILPSSLLILVTPFFIRYFKSQPEVILPGPLLWGKIVSILVCDRSRAVAKITQRLSLERFSVLISAPLLS